MQMMTSHCKPHQRYRTLRDLHPRCHLAIILIQIIFIKGGSSQACTSSQIQCLSSSCVPFSSRCDGVTNFTDGSDEFYCEPANISYALIWSTKQSSSNQAELFILYGDPDAYRGQMQLNQTFSGTVAARYIKRKTWGYNYESLETDFSASDFYFSDGHNVEFGHIATTRNSYNTAFINIIAASDSVTGLSIDWVSKLLYWSDAAYKRIGVMSSKTWLTWAPVVEDGLTSPQDVVVYPQKSFLFWSDVGYFPKIERFDLTNGVRKVIVSSADLQHPTTLVIDFVKERLLFLDSKASRIGSVLLDGSDLTFWSSALFSRISSFSLFKGYILLGDMKQPTSYVFNFTTKTYVGSISAPGGSEIIDLTVYEKAKQPAVASPCNVNNGDCEHFCITINPTSRICKCGMGYFLNTNGISCGIQDIFLLAADRRQGNIFQVNVNTGEVRAALKIPSTGFLPTAMDYDPQTMNIYAFDDFNKAIRCISISTQTSTVILQTQGATVLGIAIDTVGRLLYYIDGSKNAIVRMTISGVISTQAVLSEPNSQPRTIALDVYNRFIFWSNCYQLSNSSIEVANITSISNRRSVISGLTACPTAISVDSLNQVIYWGDTNGKIKKVGYNGTGQTLVYDGSSSTTTIVYAGLAMDETSLYISDSNQRAILRLHRATLQLSHLTALRFVEPHAIVLFYPTTPAGPPRETRTNSVSVSDSSSKISVAISANCTESSIIIACIVTISVVLIFVIITVVVVKKCRRNGSGTSDNGSVYDIIDDQQLGDFETADQYEYIHDGYEYAMGDGEYSPNDYNYLGLDETSQYEILPNDCLYVPGQQGSQPNATQQ